MDLKDELLNKLYEDKNYYLNTIASEGQKDIIADAKKDLKHIKHLIAGLKGCRLEKLGSSEGAVKPGAVAEAKLKKGASLQPMKDFEKEFYYNWTIEAIKDDKELFHKVKHWFGEWCEENISNFSE